MAKLKGKAKKSVAKRGRGRPRKEADPDIILRLASIGCSQDEIGRVTGISAATISRNFEGAYKKGVAEMKMSLRQKQYKLAMKGNVTMLIWLGKQHLGQSDKRELTGEIGVLSAEELEKRRKERWLKTQAQLAAVVSADEGGTE